jgi:hypothetical protein
MFWLELIELSDNNGEGTYSLPTILLIRGWRFFFYANEANEPIHIHCRKAEKECKYWLDRRNFDVEEAFSYRMTGKD